MAVGEVAIELVNTAWEDKYKSRSVLLGMGREIGRQSFLTIDEAKAWLVTEPLIVNSFQIAVAINNVREERSAGRLLRILSNKVAQDADNKVTVLIIHHKRRSGGSQLKRSLTSVKKLVGEKRLRSYQEMFYNGPAQSSGGVIDAIYGLYQNAFNICVSQLRTV